eukprot:scaffold146063_cov34-Prasinocladus_malaysianus.AAC.1
MVVSIKGERDVVRKELAQLSRSSAEAQAAALARAEALAEQVEAEKGAKRDLAQRVSKLAAERDDLQNAKAEVDQAYRQQARQLVSLQASQSLLHGDRRNLEDLLHENFLM